MTKIVKYALTKLGHMLAAVSLLLAVSSVNSTCLFMLYQPDLPSDFMQNILDL